MRTQTRISWRWTSWRFANPYSVCLANVFRSIGEAETTEEEALTGTGLCWTGFCIMGPTLDELAAVALLHLRFHHITQKKPTNACNYGRSCGVLRDILV